MPTMPTMNETEFAKEFNYLTGKLFGFALKLTKSREDAEDLMQETAARAFLNKDKFQVGTNFKAWVSTIMRNTFINNYRKNKKRETVENPIEDFLFAVENTSISGGAESNLTMSELDKMIGGLSDMYRIPFVMFYQGYHYDEIAEHMDLPIGTVKSRLHHAKAKLKETIEESYLNTLSYQS